MRKRNGFFKTKRFAATIGICSLMLLPFTQVHAQSAPTWDWQLSGTPDLSRDVDILDLDAGDVSKEDMAKLKARGVQTICYTSVGTLENFRDDKDKFPEEVLGKVNEHWPDERYLDIRRLDILLPIMLARFKTCADKGFDAIEPDNMDLHDNTTGFDIKAKDVVRYMRLLAQIAHELGLKIAHKNSEDLVPDLVKIMDFAIAEDCYVKQRCETFLPYARAGKWVLNAEYTDTKVDFKQACLDNQNTGISMILKDRDLTTQFQNCAQYYGKKTDTIKPKLVISGGNDG